MSLFVAVVPPPAVLGHLEAAVTPLRATSAGLQWTDQEQWHITLAFLGDVAEDRLDALRPELGQAAAGHRPFSLSLAGAGAFPGPEQAGVLWAGVSGDRAALGALARSVSAGATDAGRPYQPHLTLAYCRPAADLRALTAALAGYRGPAWTAGEIILFRSGWDGAGAGYSAVAAFALRTG